MNVQEQIASYEGLTPKVVIKMAGALQLDKLRGKSLTSPASTCDYLRTVLKSRKREVLVCIFLDTKHRVIESEELFKGSIDGADIYIRVVAEKALGHNAAAIIIAHNHPSGVTKPSFPDQAITCKLKESLLLFEIRLLDHFIIGDGEPVSMASLGMLSGERKKPKSVKRAKSKKRARRPLKPSLT